MAINILTQVNPISLDLLINFYRVVHRHNCTQNILTQQRYIPVHVPESWVSPKSTLGGIILWSQVGTNSLPHHLIFITHCSSIDITASWTMYWIFAEVTCKTKKGHKNVNNIILGFVPKLILWIRIPWYTFHIIQYPIILWHPICFSW